MKQVALLLQIGARRLVRLEIPLLALIYLYFVLTDQLPLIAMALIALIWLARKWTTGSFTRRTPLDLPILFILGWSLVSLSVSINWATSLPKIYGILLGAAFCYAIANQIQTRADLARAAFWLVLACAGIAVVGLIGTDWAQGKIVGAAFVYDRLPRFIQNIPRSIAGGFARNGVGGTIALTIPLLAAFLVSPKSKVQSPKSASDKRQVASPKFQVPSRKFQVPSFKSQVSSPKSQVQNSKPESDWLARAFNPLVLMALAFSLVTLALTQSRGGILGTAVGLLGVALWREKRFAWLIGAAVVGLGGVLAAGYGPALAEFFLRIDAQSGTLASRLEVWQRGLMMVQDFPFTGIGIGTYNQIAHLMYPFFIAAPDEIVPHAHNQLLEVAVDLGLPGLFAYVGLLIAFVALCVRGYRCGDAATRALSVGMLCGMLAHQVFGLTDAFILGTKPGIVTWVYFGFAAAAFLSTKDTKGHE